MRKLTTFNFLILLINFIKNNNFIQIIYRSKSYSNQMVRENSLKNLHINLKKIIIKKQQIIIKRLSIKLILLSLKSDNFKILK